MLKCHCANFDGRESFGGSHRLKGKKLFFSLSLSFLLLFRSPKKPKEKVDIYIHSIMISALQCGEFNIRRVKRTYDIEKWLCIDPELPKKSERKKYRVMITYQQQRSAPLAHFFTMNYSLLQ
jgi:hypothetical protein